MSFIAVITNLIESCIDKGYIMNTQDIVKNTVQQIKADNDKRYKLYLEYIDDIETIEKRHKSWNTKIAWHIIILYSLHITILIKVW